MQTSLPPIFNLEQSEKYTASVRIDAYKLSLSLHDALVDGSYFYHEQIIDKDQAYLPQIKDFFFENGFLSLAFQKMQVISATPLFTCVPDYLYKEEEKKALFSANYAEPTKDKILSNHLPFSKLHLLYAMDKAVYEFLHRTVYKPQYLHHLSSIISFFYHKTRLGNTQKMIVNLAEESVDVVCFSQSELVFANSFSCSTTADKVYYVLYVWKNLGFDQLQDHLFITGSPESREPLMKQLSHYIKNTLPYNMVPEYHLQGVAIQEVPFDQLSLSLCAL